MRRGWAIVATILVVLVVAGIAVGAYNVGLDQGIRQGADAGQVVEVVGRDWHGGGFFPFGLILFPLLVIGVFWLVGSAFRGPRGGWHHDHEHGAGRFGPWSDEGRAHLEERFGEWHRHQHEQPSGAAEPTGG